MCGIVGALRLDSTHVNGEWLRVARDCLTHRGPDDAGMHLEGGLGLAHRRLSIIDLSEAGRMPMTNETGDVWAVFNGEIYNFPALRTELEGHGHVFRSHTDSEVVVHAYEQWGTDSFARYDGMFAVAIWDRKRRRLVLARDIAGEKPLYYFHKANKVVLFASTISPLLTSPEVPRVVDPEALRLYAEFGFVPETRSIIEGVQKVAPGTFVVFEDNQAPVRHTYWSFKDSVLPNRPEREVTLDQATDHLHELLRSSVRARLVADVPLGAFLSGGIDSSLVVALMAETSARTVRTFTIGFREAAFDESEYAHRVAKHLGVENTTMVVSAADVLRELDSITHAFDEPMADYSALPSLAVARLARRHVTVALTGDGADEAFGGYRYYGATRLFEKVSSIVPRVVRRQIARAAALVPDPRVRRALARSSSIDAAAYFGRSGFYRGATASSGLLHIFPPDSPRHSPADTVASYVRSFPHLRATEAGMLWDATHTLPGAWLAKVDRTTMAVGLEARAPFLDRRVLEYAFQLPLDHRVRGQQKKIVLKRVLARYLPTELIERPKQGFTAPMRTWFANELRAELYDRLSPARVARFGVFDPAGVQKLLRDQTSGAADHTQLLWALFHLDRWYDAYIESPKGISSAA
ncbi:MAG: asparagine synthase (glutamine-hydrolyzing) [Deltaproteobacteria bacterium]|nr:asparagine synthase (glutamine-hydrolyzing) [Deltaproteobacteria bacterium]